ncbi:hypothetical protein PsorP6_002938 [Peronosclerospora sorghi]|uniref:Uncharacterized protein n=1 Tax=Peronosclerospora sorghi TaxID=230839 RepID=A0ACC0VIP1_9STRA|nr:hypothetical protein PsorP6_002938 [Peronosclerospora sorghi]
MNYGVDLNDPTVDNDDLAVGAGAQDTGTGVDTNTDDGANNDSASAVNGSVDRDSHSSEPSHDSPDTAEEGDQVSTEEGNNETKVYSVVMMPVRHRIPAWHRATGLRSTVSLVVMESPSCTTVSHQEKIISRMEVNPPLVCVAWFVVPWIWIV